MVGTMTCVRTINVLEDMTNGMLMVYAEPVEDKPDHVQINHKRLVLVKMDTF